MIEIKMIDRYTNETYIEDNYEHLYATLKAAGDVVIEVHYDVKGIEELGDDLACLRPIKQAIDEALWALHIGNSEMEEKVFKYFYNDIPEIVGDKYTYRKKKNSMIELRKLAGV